MSDRETERRPKSDTIFGCAGIIIDRGDKSEAYRRTGVRYTWESIGDGINRINGLIWHWRQEVVREADAESAAS